MQERWSAATDHEQHHLRQVLTGELRQGANAGVMADAQRCGMADRLRVIL